MVRNYDVQMLSFKLSAAQRFGINVSQGELAFKFASFLGRDNLDGTRRLL